MSASYTRRALAARRAQGLPEGVEDADAVAFLAEMLAPARRTDPPADTGATSPGESGAA